MLKLLVEKVIGRLCSLPTIAWTHAKYPSASVINSRTVRHCDMARQNSTKQSITVGSFGASPAPIGSSILSPFARKIGPFFHQNLSSLLDSTTKASLNRQSPEPSWIPILFPSRPFSHLFNRGIKVSGGILGDRFKRLESSDSHGNDRHEEKKAKARERDRRAIDKLDKNRKEPDKPLEVSKDSCKPKTQACPKECSTTSASSSSATEPKKEPQGISCSDSQKPSNLATTDHHPSKLLKTSEHIKADDPPNKDTEPSTKSLLSTNIKSHESPMSYVDKMQECSAPRLRRRKNRSRENIREHKVPDDRGLSSTDEPRKWKPTFFTSRQMARASRETRMTSASAIPKDKSPGNSNASTPGKSSTSKPHGHPPNLTTSGRCSFAESSGRISVSSIHLGDQSPSSATLKYRLSKCPGLNESWRKCRRLPAVPPDPLPKPKRRATRGNRWRCDRNIRKAAIYLDTGKWRQQRYYLRQRVYKCSKRDEASNPFFALDPCPATIEDASSSETPTTRHVSAGQSNPNANYKRRRCVRKSEARRSTKTYEMKMRESGKEGNTLGQPTDQTKKCNRNAL